MGGQKTLLDVWSEEVEGLDRQDGKPDGDGPMDVRPEQHKQPGQVNPSGQPFPESRSDDHHR